jgi:DNA modification methylase
LKPVAFLDGRVNLFAGDCLDVLAGLPENSVDSVVCDPPYHLTSMTKARPDLTGAGNPYARKQAATGFMSKTWDGGDIAFRPETWAAVLRVMKPGAHLLAFGGDRTFHRLAVAIEDAGFEVRGTLSWIFGSGFPKSLNVSARLAGSLPADAQCACVPGCSQTVQGSRSDCLADHDFDDEQLPSEGADGQGGLPSQADALKYSPFGQHVDGQAEAPSHNRLSSSAPRSNGYSQPPASPQTQDFQDLDNVQFGTSSNRSNVLLKAGHKTPNHKSDRLRSGDDLAVSSSGDSGCGYPNLPHCPDCGKVRIPAGLGSALKPAMELICMARKPLSASGIAANVLRWGTGALNIDGCRVGDGADKGDWPITQRRHDDVTFTLQPTLTDTTKGRWPANLIHDGSEEVLEAFPETTSGELQPHHKRGETLNVYGASNGAPPSRDFGGDKGSAARFFASFPQDPVQEQSHRPGVADHDGCLGRPNSGFDSRDGGQTRIFYSSKAGAEDRLGSKHPTVKPLDLMQYLCRLITPPGGTCLDCFAGTGTTGEAAWREGFNAILIEREPEYQADIARRMDLAVKPAKRSAVAKTKGKLMGAEGTPLFGDAA